MSELNDEEIKATVVLARNSLIDYCILTQDDYDPNWHHELIAKKLEEVESGEVRRLMLFMPPRHGKSELATVKFPAWYLGRNSNKEIICCSYTAELAEKFGRDTRDIVNDGVHATIFPEGGLKKGSKSATRWRVGKRGKGGFLATGVGGSITGMGAHVLIIDDPIKNREEASSPTYREKVWNWYTSTAYTRLEKGGAIIIIQTRWHDSDLAGKVLERDGEVGYYFDKSKGIWVKGEGKESDEKGIWEVVRFPAIATENEKYRKKGEALWSEKYDLAELGKIKKAIGLMDFSALYQQNPIDVEAQTFKDNWFRYWKAIPNKVRYFTAVDPAISQKTRADESVVLTVARDVHDNVYVMEYFHKKVDPSALIAEIFRQQAKYNSKVGVESQQYQYSLVHYMKQEQQKMGKYINVIPVRQTANKETRILGLEPFYRNGMIFHPPGGSDALEDQLKRFPNGKHDDIIDALNIAVYLSKKPPGTGQAGVKAIGMSWGKDGLPIIHP